MWYLVLCFWGVCAAYAAGSCAGSKVLTVTWRRVAEVAVFALVLGLSVLFKEFLALELVFFGCTCGVAFSLRMPLLRLGHRLR